MNSPSKSAQFKDVVYKLTLERFGPDCLLDPIYVDAVYRKDEDCLVALILRASLHEFSDDPIKFEEFPVDKLEHAPIYVMGLELENKLPWQIKSESTEFRLFPDSDIEFSFAGDCMRWAAVEFRYAANKQQIGKLQIKVARSNSEPRGRSRNAGAIEFELSNKDLAWKLLTKF